MKPSELTKDDLTQLLTSMTAEEDEEMGRKAHEIAERYKDLPLEIAIQLRRRDLSELVLGEFMRVLGSTAKLQ
jgi:hypothetical protein